MMEVDRAKGTMEIQPIRISSQAYSFLLVTYKKTRFQEKDLKEQQPSDDRYYLTESRKVNEIINNALCDCGYCKPELKFKWNNTNTSCGFLESELIGKHDFFYLIESSWVPELGKLVWKINQELSVNEKVRTKELIGVPCVALDFKMGKKYFVGKSDKTWFEKGNSSPIVLNPQNVHALMFIDLKRGIRDKQRRLSLPDFLRLLICPESEPVPSDIREKAEESIKGFFLGYGIYELIFLLESPNLKELFVSVTYIRRCLRKTLNNVRNTALVRGTSTMVFMPKREVQGKMDENDFSDPKKIIDYSIIVATVTGADLEVTKEISKIEKKYKKKFGKKHGKMFEINIFNRQGYYDLIASFKESSFHRSCEIITDIRNIPDVLGTSTIIKIDEGYIKRNLKGDDQDGK
ncbi:MAG: hypothetical protein HXS54_02540 [Theionarchaea archaeon]|nr:hypothetical protein [Theionarchaea archaeon]